MKEPFYNNCENFVMVSSLIKITDAPLNYTHTRSVYTHQERFDQTLNTFATVRKHIPNCKICLIDCSEFSEEETKILKEQCDYFINLIDNQELNHTLRYSPAKALCEALQTSFVIKFINENNICIKNFFKITGRYWLNDEFDYSIFDNENNVCRLHPTYIDWVLSSFYKLNADGMQKLYETINDPNNLKMLDSPISYEIFLKQFYHTLSDTIFIDKQIGLEQLISVSGERSTM